MVWRKTENAALFEPWESLAVSGFTCVSVILWISYFEVRRKLNI